MLSIWVMPCPSSGCLVMTKRVRQHKIVKMANSRSLSPLSFVSPLQKGPQMPCQFPQTSLFKKKKRAYKGYVKCYTKGEPPEIEWTKLFVWMHCFSDTSGRGEDPTAGTEKAWCLWPWQMFPVLQWIDGSYVYMSERPILCADVVQKASACTIFWHHGKRYE